MKVEYSVNGGERMFFYKPKNNVDYIPSDGLHEYFVNQISKKLYIKGCKLDWPINIDLFINNNNSGKYLVNINIPTPTFTASKIE